MANLKNKKKLAALNKENCEEHPRSSMAQNSIVARLHEDHITQVSEELRKESQRSFHMSSVGRKAAY